MSLLGFKIVKVGLSLQYINFIHPNFAGYVLKYWDCNILSLCVCHPCYQRVLQDVSLLIIEFYYIAKIVFSESRKKILIIYKFILINRPIDFDIALTTLTLCWNDVDTKLQQRCFDLVSTLCKVENPTPEFVSFSTSDQCYFNVELQLWNNVD